MDWESIGLLILLLVGYAHLRNIVRNRSVSGLVKVYVESRDKEADTGVPNYLEVFSKNCPFIVTPVPGMEYMPADLEGAVIDRVVLDDQGLLQVICSLRVSTMGNQFEETCQHLTQNGWYKHRGP